MQTKMFVIDDGARHTICARDPAAAYAEYIRMIVETGLDWPKECPECKVIPRDKDVTIDLQVNLYSKRPISTEVVIDLEKALLQNPTLTAAEWCELVGERYLACSEY